MTTIRVRRAMIGAAVFAAALLVPLTPTAGGAQSPARDDSSAVARTVQQFHQALESGDSTAALSLLAPDAVIQESGGVESRADYRNHHLPGDIKFARAVKSVRGPVAVTVQGDVAWASSTSSTQGTYGERAINSTGAELMVLSRMNGQWRIRAIHWSARNRRPSQ